MEELFDLRLSQVNNPCVFYLLLVSLIWSVSFGLFKTHLSGLDSSLAAFLRLSLSLIVFIPFFKPRSIPLGQGMALMSVGAIQYGLMYVLLNESYRHLDSWQVALMTLFTPIYIVLFDALRKRRMDMPYLAASLLAVVGAAIVLLDGKAPEAGSIRGCLLVQGADACFAIGLLLYRDIHTKLGRIKDIEAYACAYIGGALVALLGVLGMGSIGQLATISPKQWLALAYMGTVASGLCFFWWNRGSTRVTTGVLAAMSNVKIPLAVCASIVVFGENCSSWASLVAGTLMMMLGVILAGKRAASMAGAAKPAK